jgi:hypothetical protein
MATAMRRNGSSASCVSTSMVDRLLRAGVTCFEVAERSAYFIIGGAGSGWSRGIGNRARTRNGCMRRV